MIRQRDFGQIVALGASTALAAILIALVAPLVLDRPAVQAAGSRHTLVRPARAVTTTPGTTVTAMPTAFTPTTSTAVATAFATVTAMAVASVTASPAPVTPVASATQPPVQVSSATPTLTVVPSSPSNTSTVTATGTAATPVASVSGTAGPAATATLLPAQTPIPGGSAMKQTATVVASTTGTTTAGMTATAQVTGTATAGTTAMAQVTGTATAGPRTSVEVHNAPRTVRGGHSTVCGLRQNLRRLSQGCIIISSISSPGATVIYTIVYPGSSALRDSFKDTADPRGHSLHIFNVAYLPPASASHGSAATIARVTVTATGTDGTVLPAGSTRFTVIR